MPAEAGAREPRACHIHLDPLGGIAGDMFAAAIIDAMPELSAAVSRMLGEGRAGSGLPSGLTCGTEPLAVHGLSGRSFWVEAPDPEESGSSYQAVARRIDLLPMPTPARMRAQRMLARLAEVEARIHGVDVGHVHFHELAGWDTVVDLAAAAVLIEAMQPATWSVGPLPIGGGTIHSAHGRLPVPAPATAALLEGFAWVDDGVAGERVTPTGATILRELAPGARPGAIGRLLGTGYGLGTRDLGAVHNVLRAMVFEGGAMIPDEAAPSGSEAVGIVRFEIDDQLPEDLALALDRLRALPEIKDICQWAVTGKRGRVGAAVQVLCDPAAIDAVSQACLAETATIGLRRRVEERVVLAREMIRARDGAGSVGVKRTRRPGGELSAKAELGDIAAASETYAGRQRIRREAERRALDEDR